jgi:2,3-bisphosphoglycerate-independent phosphoglycerate mutase
MKPGMIGFRCNFATIDGNGFVTDRRAGRIHDTSALSQAIQDGVDLSEFGVKFVFRSGAGHRAALALEGDGLSHCVSSNDPKKEGVAPLAVAPLKQGEKEEKTAAVCNAFVEQSKKILFEHPVNRTRLSRGENPANIVLMRGAGEMGNFEPFPERYELSGSVISAASLITGIGRAVGLPHIEVPGITGSQGSNIEGKVAAAIQELKTKDFVLMNIKGTDESGHDGLCEQKKAFIERIDPLLEPLLALEDTIIIVTGDHSTPCCIKDHSADPVPVLIRGSGVRMDDVVRYDEYRCANGGLGRIRGVDLLPIALDLINKSHKFGA